MPFEYSEFFQICAVPYGVDPDEGEAKVVDVMEVRHCGPRALQFARRLCVQRQGEREDEFVFIRKVTVQVVTTFERVGAHG